MDASARARLSMKSTRYTIDQLRVFIDATSRMLLKVQVPIRRFIDKQSFDAPWLWVALFCVGLSFVTSISQPYIELYLSENPRKIKEQRRQQEELQRGEDPLPFLKHRDINKGFKTPLQIVDEADYPPESSEEYQVMQRYKAKRLEIFRKKQAEEQERLRLEEEKAAKESAKQSWWSK